MLTLKRSYAMRHHIIASVWVTVVVTSRGIIVQSEVQADPALEEDKLYLVAVV